MKPTVSYRYINKQTKQIVKDPDLIKELNGIRVPPTYTEVQLWPKNPDLQGIGLDGDKRRQYFYSTGHRERAARQKYCNLIHLGKKLPRIMRDITKLLQQDDVNQDVMDALALRVMMLCNFRVGNESNRKKYHTYGLTTITKDHVTFATNGVRIRFNGKKQQLNECLVTDPSVISFLKKLTRHKTRGDKEPLFSYNGYAVTPDSLNSFLYRYSPAITTKVWRTWFANIGYIDKMGRQKEVPETKTARQRLSNQIINEVAKELHHTSAINKKNYLIRELPELYVNHPDAWQHLKKGKQASYNFLMAFIEGYCDLHIE